MPTRAGSDHLVVHLDAELAEEPGPYGDGWPLRAAPDRTPAGDHSRLRVPPSATPPLVSHAPGGAALLGTWSRAVRPGV